MWRYLKDWHRDFLIEKQVEKICGERGWCAPNFQWPLPNVWVGVSVENQARADERIPALLQTPAAVRFLSVEPLLGSVDLGTWLFERVRVGSPLEGSEFDIYLRGLLDWVIVGGESGSDARPMHPDWVRSIRDQCQDGGVPFFFKQWGECCAYGQMPEDTYREWDIYHGTESWNSNVPRWRVGRKKAGRILDGRTHDDLPWSTGR